MVICIQTRNNQGNGCVLLLRKSVSDRRDCLRFPEYNTHDSRIPEVPALSDEKSGKVRYIPQSASQIPQNDRERKKMEVT